LYTANRATHCEVYQELDEGKEVRAFFVILTLAEASLVGLPVWLKT